MSKAEELAKALDAWDGKLMMPLGWRQQTSDELRRQAAENEALRKQMESQKDEWLSWAAKREGLEKDAERYWWIRVNGEPDEGMNYRSDWTPEMYDAAIDSAMKENPNG